MPHPHSHPLALFSLKPLNERAEAVVAHPINDSFVSTLDDGTLALDIGHIRSKSCYTLATLGRGDADICLPGSSIAKVQCSFEVDLNTNVVMLYDRSHSQTTQVYGKSAMPFEYGRPRKVVVQELLNTIIGMGGEGRDLVLFELKWHQNPVVTMEKVKNRGSIPPGYEENPRLARTIDEADTVLPSRRETRVHTPGSKQLKMRYAKIGGMLGAGQFAEVYKAVDVDSGKLMAVKILEPPVGATKQQEEDWKQSVYYALKREAENLDKINHPHIVDYIASQGWGGPKVEIFMGLKEGTLESLIESESSPGIPVTVFHQMLQALDCLAVNDIIHRDVKPANILYITRSDSEYQFQLGDFGLCNRGVSAHTFAGSPLYMAPEFFQKTEQTHKVDVWSLFVTMLWTLDVGGFRQTSKQFKAPGEVHESVSFTASNEGTISKIREMAVFDPEERASAAQMLVKCFNGVGLSTPEDQVPALKTSPSITAVRNLAPAPPPTRTAQKKPRGSQKNVNTFAAMAQCRVEKARHPLQTQPPRHAISPATEKRPGQMLSPVTTEKSQMPGAFPGDNTTSGKRKRLEGRVYFT